VKDRPTYLIGVSKCEISKLPKDFIEWDTLYLDTAEDGINFYKLPKKGDFLLLTLCTPSSISKGKAYPFQIWTTLRRFVPRKESFYMRHIGEQVEIVTQL
jgi:hypothetical protein